jgi:hypothetical protein
MLGKGGILGKGLFGNKAVVQEEKPINENMLLDDVEDTVTADIKSIFESVNNFSSYGPLENTDAHSSDIKRVKEKTLSYIFGELMSVAHQIDNGKSTIKGFSKELEMSNLDIKNSSHARTTPTPFIKRSVERIIRRAQEISAELDAGKSKMEAVQITDPLNAISTMLQSQHAAVVRCSSKVAKIRSEYESLRAAMLQKLPASTIAKIEEGKASEQNETCAEEINSSYKRFVTDQKNALSVKLEKMDLFGEVNEVPKTTGSKFGMGTLNTLKSSKEKTPTDTQKKG